MIVLPSGVNIVFSMHTYVYIRTKLLGTFVQWSTQRFLITKLKLAKELKKSGTKIDYSN